MLFTLLLTFVTFVAGVTFVTIESKVRNVLAARRARRY